MQVLKTILMIAFLPVALVVLGIRKLLHLRSPARRWKAEFGELTPRCKEAPRWQDIPTIPGTSSELPAEDKNLVQVLVLGHMKRATEGSADSQYALGALLERLAKSREINRESAKFYRKAADQGHQKAMHELALCYQCGYGVDRNDFEAFKWFSKAGKAGHAPSLTRIGAAFLSGDGVAPSFKKAMELLLTAAHQGDPRAQALVASCLQDLGDPASLKEAFRWSLKAAEGGEPKGMTQTGLMLASGNGTERNVKRAIDWLIKAAEEGDEEAEAHLVALKKADPTVSSVAARH